MTRSYKELSQLQTYAERLEYLKLLDYDYGSPRDRSFGFFKSNLWMKIRERVIQRDGAFDLGAFGVYIGDRVIVHHINPITLDDIIEQTDKLTDPNNLITCSLNTHNLIHYGDKQEELVDRKPGDTILW